MTRPPVVVLFVDASFGFGGATKSLGLVLPRLEGIQPRVITYQTPSLSGEWYGRFLVSRLRRPLTHLLREPVGRLREQPGTLTCRHRGLLKVFRVLDRTERGLANLAVTRTARRVGARAIHLNNGLMTPGGMAAARVLGLPCVAHARGIIQTPHKGHRRAASRVTHLIAVSRAAADGAERAGVAHNRISIVYDPVDMAKYSPASQAAARCRLRSRYALADDDVAVGIVGRVVAWKGQLEFVASMLDAMRQHDRLRAVVIGDHSDGPRAYFDDVVAAASRSPFADRFVFTGYQSDVEAAYAMLDVVVHASKEPEPFGMVIVEAWAASKPVVAMRAGGPAEVVRHGQDGLLVPRGDGRALTEAVLAITADPARRNAMGRAGHARASAEFSVEVACRQIEVVYEGVLGA